MELSLELMKQGSYQVEMSDEGLMTEDIESCLQVVTEGLKKSKLPTDTVVDWCKNMSQADRIDFVAEHHLANLSNK